MFQESYLLICCDLERDLNVLNFCLGVLKYSASFAASVVRDLLLLLEKWNRLVDKNMCFLAVKQPHIFIFIKDLPIIVSRIDYIKR